MKDIAKVNAPGGLAPKGHVDISDEVIFSLIDGFVWVCWPGTSVSTRLGAETGITEAMRMFLAQGAVGERLAGHNRTHA